MVAPQARRSAKPYCIQSEICIASHRKKRLTIRFAIPNELKSIECWKISSKLISPVRFFQAVRNQFLLTLPMAKNGGFSGKHRIRCLAPEGPARACSTP